MPTNKDLYELITNQHEELTKAVQFLSDQYEDIKARLDKVEQENNFLKAQNNKIQLRLESVENDLHQQQLEQRARYITIHGIPSQSTNNIRPLLVKLGKTLDKTFEENTIVSHRTIPNKTNNNHPIIVVELIDRELKEKFQDAAKKNGPVMLSQIIDTTTNNNSGTSQKVFINDYLCKRTQILFNEARRIKLSNQHKYVWCKNGKVFIRHTDDSPIIRINSINDIEKLERKFGKK